MGSGLWIVTKDLNNDEKYKIRLNVAVINKIDGKILFLWTYYLLEYEKVRLNATIINKIDGKDWFYFRNETWYVCYVWKSIWSKDNGETWHIATRIEAKRKK